MKVHLQYYPFTIPAYGAFPLAAAGNIFVCKTASGPFKINLDGTGGDFDWDQGWQFGPLPDSFRTLIFKNPTATPITIGCYVGTGNIQYSPPLTIVNLSVQNAPTTSVAGPTTIANGATIDFTGSNGGKMRKQFVVFNGNINLDLAVLDQSGKQCAVVTPRSSWTVETSAKLSLKNANNQPLDINVLEIFYA